VHRPTEDVDLFTDTEGGVRSATSVVLAALRDTGLAAWVEDEGDDLFEGMDDAFVEIVVQQGDEEVRLSLAALERYPRTEVIALARAKDPSLSDEDFSAAARRLDQVPDEPFVHYGLSADDIEVLRTTFANWPR